MELTPDQISEITGYLDASTPLPARADLLFVFGSRLEKPAHLTAELYHTGVAAYIVLTGGTNRYTGHVEAHVHRDILVNAGVPQNNIIVEDQSTNTLENVTFALPLIEDKMSISSINAVLAVCKWMHSRRALMTLKRHLPAGIRYYAHTYEPEGITRDNWHTTAPKESANVLKNWESIPKYLAKGHLAEIKRDGDAFV